MLVQFVLLRFEHLRYRRWAWTSVGDFLHQEAGRNHIDPAGDMETDSDQLGI